MEVGKFWELVTLACRLYGGSVTSGIRSSKHNAAVGGAQNSQHRFGKAADIALDNGSARPEMESFFQKSGFWVEPVKDAPNHVHVDDRWDAPPPALSES